MYTAGKLSKSKTQVKKSSSSIVLTFWGFNFLLFGTTVHTHAYYIMSWYIIGYFDELTKLQIPSVTQKSGGPTN
jgi:hypothetical protein